MIYWAIFFRASPREIFCHCLGRGWVEVILAAASRSSQEGRLGWWHRGHEVFTKPVLRLPCPEQCSVPSPVPYPMLTLRQTTICCGGEHLMGTALLSNVQVSPSSSSIAPYYHLPEAPEPLGGCRAGVIKVSSSLPLLSSHFPTSKLSSLSPFPFALLAPHHYLFSPFLH